MGKGGGAGKIEINEYRMSIHYGVCAEMDAITGILIGEKEAWTGEVDGPLTFPVSAPSLFGGQKKEGGVGGYVSFLPGRYDQVVPEFIAAKRGQTSETHPGYRGLASIYMTGSGGTDGFWWGNTAYMQGTWVRGRRAPKGLNPAYAMVGSRVEVTFVSNTVTVGGESVALADGVTVFVGGHSIALTFTPSTQTFAYTVDGIDVVVSPTGAGDDGDEPSITVEDITLRNPGYGPVNINGVTVTAGGGRASISFGSDGQDANPAHIIYECLTNSVWGMGATDDIVDRAEFEAVAKVLYNEAFGLSLLWTRESSIESFITEIIDHIQGALYLDQQTGKLTLKLFRDDYDTTTLPLITPDNADLVSYQRKLWGETINEIIVTWTNPVNEQEETVTQQDLGNITAQGGVVSDSRNYYGVRNGPLAQRLAQRDSRQSSAPLASVEAVLDRTAWNLKPGSVVRLSWPEYDIVNLVMRVTNVDYGKVGNPSIRVSLLEDIFSLEDADYNAAPETGWVSPDTDPTPMNHARVITSPAYFTQRRLSAADAVMLEYPDVLVNILAASSNPDANFFELVGQTMLPNGTSVSEELGTRSPVGFTAMPTALPEEATTLVPSFGTVIGATIPTVAGFCFIGDAAERTMEIALIDSVSDAGWVLQRGVLDTVPRAWAAGTSVWFYDIRYDFFDAETHSLGEAVNYKLLTMTSKGRLPLADAPVHGTVLTARPHLPNRPANVVVGGVAFGPVDLSGTSPTGVTVTWANRNRTMEDNTVVRWTDANVVPEAGQTTTIKLVKTNGTPLTTHAGLTGTSFTVPIADWGSETQADLVITAVRDGLESLQSVVRRVRVSGSGTITPPPPPPDEPYDPGEYFPEPWDRPCLVLGTRYLLADGSTATADQLVPGETMVWTRHIETGEWGAYLVAAVSMHENQSIYAAPGLPSGTPGHLFWLDNGWARMRRIGTPAGQATVARVTVPGATTYTTVNADGTRVVSHNLKPLEMLR